MNRSDWKLILILGILACFSFFFLPKHKKGSVFQVYRHNELILEAPLSLNQTYEVEGKLGTVEIVVENGKIMVEKETSPRHLCSKQGFIDASYESIVCLPNEIVVKIKESDNLDSVVK